MNAVLEPLCRRLTALMVSPPRNTLYYFFPAVGAFFTNYEEIYRQPLGPDRQVILRNIEDLTRAAGIKYAITAYLTENHHFSYFGGRFSFTPPALLLPREALFPEDGIKPFGQGSLPHDHETRFLIARELGLMNSCNALLKIAVKVLLFAAIFFYYATPLGLEFGIPLLFCAIGLFLLTERHFESHADFKAVNILQKVGINNPLQIAIHTLEKMRKENIQRAAVSRIAKLFIWKGNNILDFTSPLLTTRIERLKKCARN